MWRSPGHFSWTARYWLEMATTKATSTATTTTTYLGSIWVLDTRRCSTDWRWRRQKQQYQKQQQQQQPTWAAFEFLTHACVVLAGDGDVGAQVKGVDHESGQSRHDFHAKPERAEQEREMLTPRRRQESFEHFWSRRKEIEIAGRRSRSPEGDRYRYRALLGRTTLAR